jgi:hypothetical protein
MQRQVQSSSNEASAIRMEVVSFNTTEAAASGSELKSGKHGRHPPRAGKAFQPLTTNDCTES